MSPARRGAAGSGTAWPAPTAACGLVAAAAGAELSTPTGKEGGHGGGRRADENPPAAPPRNAKAGDSERSPSACPAGAQAGAACCRPGAGLAESTRPGRPGWPSARL